MRLIDADALREDIETINYADWNNYSDTIDLIDDAPTIEAEPVRQWVPCSERMPEIGVMALICAVDGCRTTARYCADREWHLTTGGFLHDSNVVTHWMPLPEPPELERTGDNNENS